MLGKVAIRARLFRTNLINTIIMYKNKKNDLIYYVFYKFQILLILLIFILMKIKYNYTNIIIV